VRANLTTRDVGLNQPEWLIRRVVDSLMPPVERFGNNRLIPSARLDEVRVAVAVRLARRAEQEVTDE